MRLLFLVIFLFPCSIFAADLTGRVVGVRDGDTLTVLVEQVRHEIRLSGIDAPERGQPYGNVAKQHLTDLVLNKQVRVEGDKTDRYGRIVGKVWVQSPDCPACGKNLDVNLGLLTVGLAWWYRFYIAEQSDEDRARYEFAEYEAKSKKAGLWKDEDSVAPWDWRKAHRALDEVSSECTIKGNISTNGRIYHLPDQRYYAATRIDPSKGERWFCNEAEAQAAGWRKAGE